MKEALPANTTISHYRIISRLGAGGMGEVYLAKDTKLRRKVALKLLSGRINQERRPIASLRARSSGRVRA